MPIEKRPAHPVPKGARAGSRPQPHHVGDGETFATVASKYGVPVDKLIQHNFGTLDPAELNWYLREYVGCKVPTKDGKNWRFSSTATPGLIYLPDNVMRMEPIAITGKVDAPIRLDLPGPISVLSSNKYAHEFKLPPDGPRDLGYLLIQGRFVVEGEMKQEGGLIKTSLKKDQIKAGFEAKLTEDTKATFALKFDEKSLTPIANAVASGSKEGWLRAIAAPFEASIKTTYRWGKLAVVPELGGEVSTTPVVIRVAGEFEDYLILEGARFKGKFVVKVGFNVGLSLKGWAWVGDKVGRPVLQRFLASSGRALAAVGEWLVAEGVLLAGAIAIGTIVGTLALTSLCAWLVADAKRKGELTGLATWYVSAFTARVFGEPRPTGFIIGDTQLRDRLVTMGEADALTEARAALKKLGHSAANGTDAAVFETYRNLLVAGCGGRYDNAKIQLRVALEEKSRKLVGL
jgi:hypothetical protein